MIERIQIGHSAGENHFADILKDSGVHRHIMRSQGTGITKSERQRAKNQKSAQVNCASGGGVCLFNKYSFV